MSGRTEGSCAPLRKVSTKAPSARPTTLPSATGRRVFTVPVSERGSAERTQRSALPAGCTRSPGRVGSDVRCATSMTAGLPGVNNLGSEAAGRVYSPDESGRCPVAEYLSSPPMLDGRRVRSLRRDRQLRRSGGRIQRNGSGLLVVSCLVSSKGFGRRIPGWQDHSRRQVYIKTSSSATSSASPVQPRPLGAGTTQKAPGNEENPGAFTSPRKRDQMLLANVENLVPHGYPAPKTRESQQKKRPAGRASSAAKERPRPQRGGLL
jgi:hypothetical protein